MSLNGKIVLITGGTHGIGLTLAQQLVERSACVIITGRSQDKANKALTAIKGEAHFISCDISNAESVKQLFAEINTRYGRLDLAVNNAGVTSSRNSIKAIDLNNWQDTININLTGTFLCLQQEIELISRQPGGAIVNVSSCAGVVPIPGQAAYSVSKAAINCLTKIASMECALDQDHRYAVRINAVAPGPTLGGMNSPERLATNPEATRQKMAVTSMKRMATAEEIAAAILFLLSSEASYITGTILEVDGGYSSGKFI